MNLESVEHLADPKYVKFWGTLFPMDGDDYSKYPRLIGAIYDHLKNTTKEPLEPSLPTNPISYVTPHMMAVAFDLFDWDYLRFPEDEQKRVDAHAIDALLIAYYKLHNLVFHTCTRPGGPEGGLPLFPRFLFKLFIYMNINADPPTMRRKINAILAGKGQKTVIDPYTELPFQYPDIPLCAFPAEPNALIKANMDMRNTKWREMKSDILKQSTTNQQSVSSTAAGRLAQLAISTPAQPPQGSQTLSNPTPRPKPPPQRSEAQILAQLQAFRILPSESDAASRARFDAIVEGVDDATIERLLGHARLQERLTELNAANAILASTQMQNQAVADGFKSQDAAMMSEDRWFEWRRVWR